MSGQKKKTTPKVVNNKSTVVKSVVKPKTKVINKKPKNEAVKPSKTAPKKVLPVVSPEVPYKFKPPGVGGRPPKYKSVPELQKLIDEYFESCWAQKIDMFGTPLYLKDKSGRKTEVPVMIQVRPYTITGLALAIGTNRQTLLNYETNDKFLDTIKRAKERCQTYAEESLFIGKNPTGAIFNLKNNYRDWKDKTETEHSGNLVWTEEPPK